MLENKLQTWLLAACVGLGIALFGAVAPAAESLSAAGATFPYPLYSKWFSVYQQKAGVEISYQAIGSGGGIRALKNGTVDIGASDAPLSDAEMKDMPGYVLHLPTVAGAVAVAYNLPGLEKGLKLSPDVLANLFLGNIRRWNDRRIADLNPGVNLPNLPVAVVHRSDGSGTSYIFTSYLNAVSRAWAKRVGFGKSVDWPTGLGASGNAGVAGVVKQTPGAVAYVELAYAIQNHVPYAAIRNHAGNFVEPTESTTAVAAASAVKAMERDVRVSIVNSPAENAYPVCGFTYLLVYQKNHSSDQAQAITKFLSWSMHEGQGYATKLLYVPLPEEIVKMNDAKIRTIGAVEKRPPEEVLYSYIANGYIDPRGGHLRVPQAPPAPRNLFHSRLPFRLCAGGSYPEAGARGAGSELARGGSEGPVRGGRSALHRSRARTVRVMLAGFFHGVVHDRALVREAQVNLAYRWFAGYALDEALPEHSSLTRIRQRWGEDRFRRIFERTVTQCVQAGLVGGQTLHVDASLIRADVSWSSLVPAHVARVWAENEASEEAPAPKKISTTDPEASLATSNPGQRLEPSYKQHTAVDDRAGVIVDVQVTTGAESESRKLLAQVQQVQAQLGVTPQVVTADRGYASSANYAALEQAGIQGVIPPQPEATSRRGVPLRRFAYDAKHDCARCPAGKRLTRRNRSAHGWFYRRGPGTARPVRGGRSACPPRLGREACSFKTDTRPSCGRDGSPREAGPRSS